MRHEVKTFAQCMEHKLKKNDHKGGWENVSNEKLFELLRQEVDELEKAMQNEPELNSVFEAADIANFAMMIAWNMLRRMVAIPPLVMVQPVPTSFALDINHREERPYCLHCMNVVGKELPHGGHKSTCPDYIPF